jgi:hypothetical protein
MMIKNCLPNWYPKPHHVAPITLEQFLFLLRTYASIAQQDQQLKKLIPPDISPYYLTKYLGKVRLFKSLDIIELLTWASIENVHLSHSYIANTLWSYDPVHIEKRYRETARPLAFCLLHPRAIDCLSKVRNKSLIYI